MVLALLAATIIAGAPGNTHDDLAFVARFYNSWKTSDDHAYVYLSDLDGKHRRRIARTGSILDTVRWVGRERIVWTDGTKNELWIADAPSWKPRLLFANAGDIVSDATAPPGAVWVQAGGNDFLLAGKKVLRQDHHVAPHLRNFGTGRRRLDSAQLVSVDSSWTIEARTGKKVNRFTLENGGKSYAVTNLMMGLMPVIPQEMFPELDFTEHHQRENSKRSWLVGWSFGGFAHPTEFLFAIDWEKGTATNFLLDVCEISLRPGRGVFAGRSERRPHGFEKGDIWTNEAVVGNLLSGKVKAVLSGRVFVGGISLRP